jgi:hypothetical protein
MGEMDGMKGNATSDNIHIFFFKEKEKSMLPFLSQVKLLFRFKYILK